MKRLVIFARVLCAGGVVAGLLALALVPVRAQSPTLGEVAKKEAERRKAQPSAGKVYSNKDLPPSAQKPAAPATGAGTQTTIPLDPVAAVEKEKEKEEAKPDGETRD